MAPDEGAREASLRLEACAGPPLAPVSVPPDRTCSLGRSSMCDVQLPDPTVSRRHAMVSSRAGTWFIVDLQSRHGLTVNGARVGFDTPTPLRDADLIGIGPWTFRARIQRAAGSTMPLGPAALAPGERVAVVPARELRSLAQHRLDLLIECAARINSSRDEQSLAASLLEAAMGGAGFPRGAVLRPLGQEVEVLARRGPETDAPLFARSLLESALAGEVAYLQSDNVPVSGDSIARLGIHAALCAPVHVGESVDAVLYLDARRQEMLVQPDAAAFCQAVCRIGGLALAGLRKAAVEQVNAEIMRDVGAAAAAQRLLMPPPAGRLGPIDYVVHMRPGRIVAGDLFNILELPGGRVGAYLGDVAGKGVGAAILMATTQAMLNAALRRHADPALALNEVGPELAPMLPSGRFITLWVGVFDTRAGSLDVVDAGHGHWLLRAPGEAPRLLRLAGGLPLGIEPGRPYQSERVGTPPGTRLIVFSDGVVEQRSPGGEEFGVARVIETARDAADPRDEVEGILGALLGFARAERLADDVTCASLALRP